MTHPLTRLRDAELSLEELVQAASDLLAAAPEPADARVQPLPDARTIRYYQTSGLVDRPLRYAGREARYGYRHLLQVLAVKLLQRHGHRLARIQNALAGLTDDRLQSAVIDGLGTDPSPRPPLNPVRLPSDPAEGPRAAPRRPVRGPALPVRLRLRNQYSISQT